MGSGRGASTGRAGREESASCSLRQPSPPDLSDGSYRVAVVGGCLGWCSTCWPSAGDPRHRRVLLLSYRPPPWTPAVRPDGLGMGRRHLQDACQDGHLYSKKGIGWRCGPCPSPPPAPPSPAAASPSLPWSRAWSRPRWVPWSTWPGLLSPARRAPPPCWRCSTAWVPSPSPTPSSSSGRPSPPWEWPWPCSGSPMPATAGRIGPPGG